MRSNNAWTLFPYNVFEFSLIAEMVAAEVGVRIGSYHHFANSMHIYKNDFLLAQHAIEAGRSLEAPAQSFPEMPTTHVRKNLARLLQYEIKVRSNFSSLNGNNYKSYLREAEDFGGYWGEFAKLLLIHGLRKANKLDYGLRIVSGVKEPIKGYLQEYRGPLFDMH